jgi:hypothetical protein
MLNLSWAFKMTLCKALTTFGQLCTMKYLQPWFTLQQLIRLEIFNIQQHHNIRFNYFYHVVQRPTFA